MLAAVLLLVASVPAAAQLPWYQVEVVIVSQGGEAAWLGNNWREEGPPPLGENAVELLVGSDPGNAGGGKRRHAFRMLPASMLDLGGVVDRLERSSDYRVLLHVGWRQPGFPIDDAPGVHLGTFPGHGSGNRLPGAREEAVEGTVRLWRRRFLHVDADIAFGEIDRWRERTAREADRASDRLRVVRLTRSLRLKAGRLHFVDHPLFGVLLIAKPLN